VFQRGWTCGRHILTTFVNVGLDHDTSDALLARRKLLANVGNDKRLVFVIFLRVAV
jgi:hypothetical protein